MDEMDVLSRMREDAPSPDRARLAPGRRMLLDAAAGNRRARRAGAWFATLGAAAAVTASAVVVTLLPGSDEPAGSGPAAGGVSAFERAARTVERQEPGPRVKDGQWLYREYTRWTSDMSYGATSPEASTLRGKEGDLAKSDLKAWTGYGKSLSYETDYEWRPAKMRRVYDGPYSSSDSTNASRGRPSKWLDICHNGLFMSPTGARDLAARLPENTAELRTYLRDAVPKLKVFDDYKTPLYDYRRATAVLACVPGIPPKKHAALLRLLAEVPGATLSEKPVKDLKGRDVLVLTVPDPQEKKLNNLRKDIYLDPETYAYLGDQDVFLAGGSLNGKKTTAPVIYRAALVVAEGITDKPGKTP